MDTVALPGGEQVPALGMESWRMGENPARRREEIATVRLGVDLGMSLIDTAEKYGEGPARCPVCPAQTRTFAGNALNRSLDGFPGDGSRVHCHGGSGPR
jgi:diketogulonate reductase-like aldo/keto reductase